MIKYLLFVCCSGLCTYASAQNSNSKSGLSTLTKIDLGFQGVGITYEPRLSNHITTDLSAGVGGGYDIAEGYINYSIKLFRPAFYFSVTPKYFYNVKKRLRKEKNTSLNSANCIGVRLKYVTPNSLKNDFTRNSILANVHWGLQRAIGGNWTINTHLGLGYAQDIDYNFGTIYPAIELKFSYVLNER